MHQFGLGQRKTEIAMHPAIYPVEGFYFMFIYMSVMTIVKGQTTADIQIVTSEILHIFQNLFLEKNRQS